MHVADSLSALPWLPAAGVIADLGSGAGLPGIVLAIARPELSVALVESVGRRAAFLARVVDELALANVSVVVERVESWHAGLGACDVVCARALAALPVLCEYAAPLLRTGGEAVFHKGRLADAEAAAGAAACAALGLAVLPVVPVEPFAGAEHRVLWRARKVAPTPARFPRRPGVAARRPLGGG